MLAGGCGHRKGWLELEDPLPTWPLDQISLCSRSLTARHWTSPRKGDRRRAKRKPQWVLWTSLQNHTLPLFSSWPEVSPWSRSHARRRELGSPLEERRIKGFVDILLTHRHLCDLEPEISSSPLHKLIRTGARPSFLPYWWACQQRRQLVAEKPKPFVPATVELTRSKF